MRRLASALALVAAFTCVSVQARQAATMNFVTCPIARDTNDVVVCWIVEHGGETYFLGWQGNQFSDWYSPMLKHRVVVEDAVVSPAGERVCGGLVLTSFRSSPVYDIDENCDQVLPSDPRYQPDPDYWRNVLIFGGQGAVTDKHVGFFQHPRDAKPPVAPFSPQNIDVFYDVNWITSRHRSVPAIERAADYAMAAKWKITIFARHGEIKMSDGSVLTESDWISKHRAMHVRSSLVALGVPEADIDIKWTETPVKGAGFEDWKARSATLSVHP